MPASCLIHAARADAALLLMSCCLLLMSMVMAAGQPRGRVQALCCLLSAADVNGDGCRATLGTGADDLLLADVNDGCRATPGTGSGARAGATSRTWPTPPSRTRSCPPKPQSMRSKPLL